MNGNRSYLLRPTHLENSPPTTRSFASSDGLGTPDNFTVLIDLPRHHNFNRVCMMYGAVPRSMYAVALGQNYFTLSEPGFSDVKISVPAKNYALADWMATLTVALNTGSPGGRTYDVDFDDGTGKFIFTVTAGLQPSFIFSTFMYNMLGFLPSTTNTFVANTITSSALVNLQPVPMLYLKSDLVFDADSRQPDLLADIFVGAPDGTWVSYVCPDPRAYAKKMIPTGSNVFHFYFRDSLGNAVDFNGQRVYLSLLFYRDASADEMDKFVVPAPKPLYRPM